MMGIPGPRLGNGERKNTVVEGGKGGETNGPTYHDEGDL